MTPTIQDLINALALADDEKEVLWKILVSRNDDEAELELTESIFSSLITILKNENCPESVTVDLDGITFTVEQFPQILEALLNNPRITNRMLSLHGCFDDEWEDPIIRKQVIKLLSDNFKKNRIPANFCLDLSCNTEFTSEEIETLGNSLIFSPLPENLSLNLSLTNLLEIIFDILEKSEIANCFTLNITDNTVNDINMERLSKAISQLRCSNFSLKIHNDYWEGHGISDKGFISLLKSLEFNNKIKNFTFDSYVDIPENYIMNNSPTSLGERWLNLLYANPNLNITFSNWKQLDNVNMQNQRFAAMGHQNGEELSTATQELLTLTVDHPRAILNFTRWLVTHADLDDIEQNTFFEVINEIVNKVSLPPQC